MDSILKQSNYLDLKFEDNDEHYLINSLLGFNKNDPDIYIDDLIYQPHPKSAQPYSQCPNPSFFEDRLIEEVSSYICFRTTSLTGIYEHIEQHYPIAIQKKNIVMLAIRKHKLRLKRDHAKSKQPNTIQRYKPQPYPVISPQIKQEQQQGSPFVFDEESQQTRKKKRNRMSAQNSRDKKKQYIQQIQKQNQQLKKKLKALSESTGMSAIDRDFIKTILSLGIASYNNFHQPIGQSSPVTYITQDGADQYDLSQERYKEKHHHTNLPNAVSLLAESQQKVIYRALGCLGEMQDYECSETKYQGYNRRAGIVKNNQ